MPNRPAIGRQADEAKPGRDHAGRAEAADQAAGPEARAVHGDDVPLQAEIGRFLRVAAQPHGQWRCGHEEVHQQVGNDAARDGEEKARLLDDDAQRPAALSVGDIGHGKLNPQQDNGGDRRGHGLPDIGGRKQMRRRKVHRIGDELRPQDAREHAARHDRRQGAGAPLGGRAIGGGKPKAQDDGGIYTGQEGRDAEQPEGRICDGEGREEAGDDPAACSQHEHGPAPITLRDGARGQGAEGHAHDENGDGQGRERRARCQRVPHNRAGGEDDRGVHAREGLGDGEPQNVATLQAKGGRQVLLGGR